MLYFAIGFGFVRFLLFVSCMFVDCLCLFLFVYNVLFVVLFACGFARFVGMLLFGLFVLRIGVCVCVWFLKMLFVVYRSV